MEKNQAREADMASASTIMSHRGPSVVTDHREQTDDFHLARFLGGNEAQAEDAFSELVRRHGPMVLGVCRHVLEHHSDAEDAFQATFLVLARNAASIRDHRVLANWLYEVAYRIAIRSRTRSAQRRSREKEVARMSALADGQVHDPAWTELRPVLHEEVNRLPEKYRKAVVLCYLEGRANEEAATLLGWPVGTVKGRLSRARDLLRSRLTRRGLALSAAFLALRLSKNEVFAELVPSRLVATTTRSALTVTRGAGIGAIPARIRELTKNAAPARRWWWSIQLLTRQQLTLGSLIVVVIASSLFCLSTVFANGGGPVVGGARLDVLPPARVVIETELAGHCDRVETSGPLPMEP